MNARTLHEFQTTLEDIIICLCSKKQTKVLRNAYARVNARIQNMDKLCSVTISEFQKESIHTSLDYSYCDDGVVIPSSNRFVDLFSTIFPKVKECVEKDSANSCKSPENENCPKFLRFITKYLSEMALWSGILLGDMKAMGRTEEFNKIALVGFCHSHRQMRRLKAT